MSSHTSTSSPASCSFVPGKTDKDGPGTWSDRSRDWWQDAVNEELLDVASVHSRRDSSGASVVGIAHRAAV